jgi:hypothetical protein
MGHRIAVASVVLACGLATSASAGTKMLNSSRVPSAGPLNFGKVLVLVIAPHESQMQFGEGLLVGMMKKTRGVSAHSLLPKDDARDEQKMRALMAKEGFDGAVTLKLLNAGQETSTISQGGVYASTHTGFWSYYSYAWPLVNDIGYVHTQRVYHMEAQVYSMKDDKLVWYGITKTTNPKDARQLVEDVAKEVAKDLRKQRLIE